ncbi:phytanoyl-CoA dioxygenase family protein [Acinetobacter sp. MB5]|uniref:phytanoyl-CoA dioxygenase family protein n=1 Tax=Acinetobacter sp. MB5 TaxID=2069438 RepID=UPI000DD068AD|nr:phytanoyl-CoA dioxygenase family protein [Acinetobacter sp. MB5]
MELIRLPNTATSEEVAKALKEHGHCIVENLVAAEVMDRIAEEMSEFITTSPYGEDKFLGNLTQRTGALVARSETARELIRHPLVLDSAKKHLSKSSTMQLQLTQIITVNPGAPSQILHQDQLAWDFFDFPDDFETQCNTLWAMTEYTEENGATRVVPNSMYAGARQKFTEEQTLVAEMPKGSVMIYTGKIYHGAGTNTTDKIRQAININYCAGWLRQEENQYLATPPEIAQTLDDEMLKLMGYQCACFAMGYVRDFEDPLDVFRGKKERRSAGFNVVTDNGNDVTKNYAEELGG